MLEGWLRPGVSRDRLGIVGNGALGDQTRVTDAERGCLLAAAAALRADDQWLTTLLDPSED